MRAILFLVAMFVSLTAAVGREAWPSAVPNVQAQRPVGGLGDMQDGDIEALALIVMMQSAASAQEDLRAIMARVKAVNEAKKAQRRLMAASQLSGNPCAGTGGAAWRACARGIERHALRLHLGALDVMKAAAVEARADTRAMLEAMNRARTAEKAAPRERVTGPDLQRPRNACAESGVRAWRLCLTRIDERLAGNMIDERSKAEIDTLVETIKNDLDSMSEMGEMESLRLQMAMDRLSKIMSTLSNLLKKVSDTASAITQNLK